MTGSDDQGRRMVIDRWGCDISVTQPTTSDAWFAAIDSYLRFSGDPVALAGAIDDPAFVRGPIFTATMKLLGGTPAADPSVTADLDHIEHMVMGATPAEQAHVAALRHLVAGNVSLAAAEWAQIAERSPADVLAIKCAHEAAFLVGDVAAMLVTAETLARLVEPNDATFHVVAGQFAFALEESERYDEAEQWAKRALAARDDDLWALHALTHVYESQHRHNDAMGLLEGRVDTWSRQNLLSVHIWWHLGLRLIAAERFTDALELFDRELAAVPADGRFRLTDGISLLWRLELAGVDVGARWGPLADKWAVSAQRHSNAFLDLHGALTFIRQAGHPGAIRFFDSLCEADFPAGSQLATIHTDVTVPLIDALRSPTSLSPARARALVADARAIGGSAVQRAIVAETLLG